MIDEKLDAILKYYLQPGKMDDLGDYAPLIRALPGDLTELVRILQGLVVHIFWAERYGVALSDDRKSEVNIRAVAPKIARLLQIDARPIIEARPPDLRLVGNCRDFSLLLSALLKAHGIPARPRCGFGTYFMPDHLEDHWMTEAWDASLGRWRQVDSQLDDLQKQVLGVSFDTLDMPPGQFVLAGEAWQLCRIGKANPDDFGIFQWHGWDFIRGNLMRDLLALNGVVVLPWDYWSALETPVASFSTAQMEEMDRIAWLTLQGNAAFSGIRSAYETNPEYQIPPDWINEEESLVK